MKKILFLLLLTCFVVSAFSQNAVPLNTGLSNSAKLFEERIPKGTKLVVLNIRSSSPQLSEYIREELSDHFVNRNHFTVVDRSNLELLQQEMAFQLSGEVSDETALSIGKKLGAQIIISGSIESFGDVFRLRIQAIAVESAAIQASFSANIQRDRFLASLAGTSNNSENTRQNTNSQPPTAGNTTPSQGSQSGNTGARVRLPDYLLTK